MAGIINKPLVGVVLLLISFTVSGQSLDELTERYPDKNACYLLKKEHYEIDLKGDELEVRQYVTEEVQYLNDKVASAVKEQVHFSSFFNLVDLEAASYIPKGNGKYRKVSVNNFKENTNVSRMAFYDDTKEKVFYFSELEKGAKTKLEYELEVTQPNLLSGFFLQSYYPCERIEVSVTYPEGVELGYKIFNLKEDEVEFSKETKGGKTTLTWIRTQVEDAEFEYDAPNPKYYLPQIHPFIISVTTKEGKQTHVGTVDNLHKWYRELIVDYEKATDESTTEMEEIVDSLVQGLTDEKEKVKAIYQWVQSNIQYIAFEYELSGFVPRPAAKVCTRRFGDCKDMSSIIKEMLGIAGIDAYLTWIGTRSIPYTYSELSTPSVDNHMIATYFDSKGTPYFLDATDKYISFGDPASHIQGKEALVSLSPTEYKVIEVPIRDKEFTNMIDTVWISINDMTIEGNGHMIETGYYKNYATYNLIGKNEKETFKYFKSVLQKGSNKFSLKDYNMSNLNEIYKPLDITYTFEVEDYLQSYEDELYLDMNLYKGFGTKIEDDRELAFNYRFAKRHHETYILEIPDGYELTYIPKNYDESIDGFHYAVTYKQEGNKLIYDIKLDRSVLIMDKSYFEGWNKLFNNVNQLSKETIVLKKSN